MKLTLALVIGLALLSPPAGRAGQDAGQNCEQHADRVYTTREVDETAKITHRPEPTYPARLRRKRLNGEVELRMVLRPDGRVTDIEILESTHEAFSEASITAAKKFRFEPATKGGCPVAQAVIIINQYTIY